MRATNAAPIGPPPENVRMSTLVRSAQEEAPLERRRRSVLQTESAALTGLQPADARTSSNVQIVLKLRLTDPTQKAPGLPGEAKDQEHVP